MGESETVGRRGGGTFGDGHAVAAVADPAHTFELGVGERRMLPRELKEHFHGHLL
jgi:hypothetical protein